MVQNLHILQPPLAYFSELSFVTYVVNSYTFKNQVYDMIYG